MCFIPAYTPLLYGKTGVYRGIHNFLIFAPKHRLQLELSASNTVKVDYRLPVTCSDFNSTTVNSLGLDFIDLLPVTLSISYRCLNVVSNTDLCTRYVVIITMAGVACF